MGFLISSQRTYERDALSEAYYVISDILGYNVHPLKSRVPGLSILCLKENEINPYEVIEEIRQYIDDKGPLIACLKIVPLERVIKTDLPTIVEVSTTIAKDRILPTNTWRITVRKRQTNLRTHHIIEEVAELINWGKVDLINPNFEIRIEIVRDITGISVMKPNFEIRMINSEKGLS